MYRSSAGRSRAPIFEDLVDEATVRTLAAINQHFYDETAESFSQTREGPWSGWETLLGVLPPAPVGPLRVLDVGCGNGRFADFLATCKDSPSLPEDRGQITYRGIDSSQALLRAARCRDPERLGEARFDHLDVLERGVPESLGSHHWICCFGLLHHIPGKQHRRQLVERLAAQLAPGGVLILAFWQFADQERFRRRFLPWAEWNERQQNPLDLTQLERGDHLLPWGSPAGPVRYCHHVDAEEQEMLCGEPTTTEVAHFCADGRSGDLNLYSVLRAG